MADIAKFLDEIKKLTVLELAELVKALETEFGVSAAAPVAAAAPAAAGAAAPVEEKTEFTVAIKAVGASKLNVIKAVRELTGLGLAEAKTLVESNGVVKENTSKSDADKIVEKLKEAGAEVQVS